MSAYQTNTNNNQLNEQYQNLKHNQPGELNENHGIAATGLNDPHSATAPFVQGNAGSRRHQDDLNFGGTRRQQGDLNYTGPPLGGNSLDQSGNKMPGGMDYGGNTLGSNNMSGGMDYSRGGNTLGQTGNSMPSDTNYSGPPISGNTLDQSGTNNTAAGINTTPGGQVNHHQGLAGNTGFNNDSYGTNTNSLSTHQPKNDVIHSTTAGNTGLNYSGVDTDIRNLDQSGGFDSNNKHHSTAHTHTGTTGQNVHSSLDNSNRHAGVPPATARDMKNDIERDVKQGATGQHVHSSLDNSNRIPPATVRDMKNNMEHDIKHDVEHKSHKNMTAPEGDHGASHHMKEHGNIDDNGVRHAGAPLHDGMGKVKPESERRKYDAEHLGNDDSLDHRNPTGEHPLSSDGVSKPSVGDKIKGNLEKVAGKISGNEAKVIKGENIAHGRQ